MAGEDLMKFGCGLTLLVWVGIPLLILVVAIVIAIFDAIAA